MTKVSRRSFFVAAAGLTSSAVVFMCGESSPDHVPKADDSENSERYVDHDGWLLTPADKEKVTSSQAP
jgi:hypothetical protein